MLNALRYKNTWEQEAKFIQDRIIHVEKSIADFCNIFAQYSRKVARVRDKGDDLTKIILTFSENEHINKSLSIGLEHFAKALSLLGDYGELRVQNIEGKIVGEFSRYESICKHVKEEVKEIFNARDKEINKKRQLDRIRERNPRSRQQIVQAETDLVKASAEMSKSLHNLEEKTTTFERQKLHDIKVILLDFVSIEMGYHAKALQILTKAYNDIENIEEDSDIEEFKKSLRESSNSTIPNKTSFFKTSTSLGSLGNIFATAHTRNTPGIPGTKQPLSKSEETLDSIKHTISITDSDLTTEDDDEASLDILSDSDLSEKTSESRVDHRLQ